VRAFIRKKHGKSGEDAGERVWSREKKGSEPPNSNFFCKGNKRGPWMGPKKQTTKPTGSSIKSALEAEEADMREVVAGVRGTPVKSWKRSIQFLPAGRGKNRRKRGQEKITSCRGQRKVRLGTGFEMFPCRSRESEEILRSG